MSGIAVIVTFILFAIAGAVGFYFIPKSPDQIPIADISLYLDNVGIDVSGTIEPAHCTRT
ncbi:hypothetical protein SpCBS45565_g08259 [Spizellomyces sp. 'palustris']|nr:hypothetical protein SpCBS45565_g08259 [Spizellomyces sp. 'palustris']